MEMENSFKEYKLTDSETLWLKAVFDKNFERFSIKALKVELWDDLSNNFDPDDLDWRFYRNNRITLVGLWHIDPQNFLFSLCTKVIRQIKKEIRKRKIIKKVVSSNIGREINTSPEKVGIAILLLNDLGFFKLEPGMKVYILSEMEIYGTMKRLTINFWALKVWKQKWRNSLSKVSLNQNKILISSI